MRSTEWKKENPTLAPGKMSIISTAEVQRILIVRIRHPIFDFYTKKHLNDTPHPRIPFDQTTRENPNRVNDFHAPY